MTLKELLIEKGYSDSVQNTIEEILDIDDTVTLVDNKKIHGLVSLPKGYILEGYGYLIGFSDSISKLIYYVGGEHSSKLVFKFNNLSIYEIEEDRFPLVEE